MHVSSFGTTGLETKRRRRRRRRQQRARAAGWVSNSEKSPSRSVSRNGAILAFLNDSHGDGANSVKWRPHTTAAVVSSLNREACRAGKRRRSAESLEGEALLLCKVRCWIALIENIALLYLVVFLHPICRHICNTSTEVIDLQPLECKCSRDRWSRDWIG